MGIFWDHLGTFLSLVLLHVISTIFQFLTQVLGFIGALEYAAHNGWRNIWMESDSTSVLSILKNASLVPISIWNRWHSALRSSVQIISSHIFRDVNCFTDKITKLGTRFGKMSCLKLFRWISLATYLVFRILDSFRLLASFLAFRGFLYILFF